MEEKTRVISVLRALLISNSKKQNISLHELKRDYCLEEGRKEIPLFGHKHFRDFLFSSGEFVLYEVNGNVMVREKQKPESLHVKKLVTQQRSSAKFKARMATNKNFECVSPVHIQKPSTTFTFDRLKDTRKQLNNITKAPSMSLLKETERNKKFENENPSNLIKTRNETFRKTKPLHAGKPTTTFTFDMTKAIDSNFVRNPPCKTNAADESNIAARLLEMVLPFNVVSMTDGRYKASVFVNNTKYFGVGCTIADAKNEASASALNNLTNQKHYAKEISSFLKKDEISLIDDSNALLNLHQTMKDSNCNSISGHHFTSTVMVREMEKNKSTHPINNIEKVFKDKRTLLSLKINATKEWKTISMNNGSCKVTVKIDGIDYFGEGSDFTKARSNCIKNALRVNGNIMTKKRPEEQKDSFTRLNNKCIGFYKTLSCDAKNNYKAMIQLDSIKYFGVGRSSDEANENAADQCLNAINSGKHKTIVASRAPLEDVAPNASFMVLNDMYVGLKYQIIGRDKNNYYKTVIQVDSVNYYGNGRSVQSSANNASDTCIKSIKYGRHKNLAENLQNLC